MPRRLVGRYCYPLEILVLVAILAELATPAAAKPPKGPDYPGLRFRCGDLASDRICLPYLKADCELQFVPGVMIPRQVEDHLMVEHKGEALRVNTPSDLSGCVQIVSPQDALEYLRFFSSLWTIHLFDQEYLEIFPARRRKRSCIKTCLPAKTWDRLGFEVASVRQVNEGFEITRFVIKRDRSSMAGVKVLRVAEHVSPSGKVSLVSEQAFELSLEDIAGLMFPYYL